MPGSVASASSSDSVYTRLSHTSTESTDYEAAFARQWAATNALARSAENAEGVLFRGFGIISSPSMFLTMGQAIYPAGSDQHRRLIARLQAQAPDYELLPVAERSLRRAPLMLASRQATELVAQIVLGRVHEAVHAAARDRRAAMVRALDRIGGLEEVQFRPEELMDALDDRNVDREMVLHGLEAMWRIVKAQKELDELVQHGSGRTDLHAQMDRLVGVTTSWTIEGGELCDSLSSSEDEDHEVDHRRRDRLRRILCQLGLSLSPSSSEDEEHEHDHHGRGHMQLVPQQHSSSSSEEVHQHQHQHFRLDLPPLNHHQDTLIPSQHDDDYSGQDPVALVRWLDFLPSGNGDNQATSSNGHAHSVYSSYSSYPVIGGGARRSAEGRDDVLSVESWEDWEASTADTSMNH